MRRAFSIVVSPPAHGSVCSMSDSVVLENQHHDETSLAKNLFKTPVRAAWNSHIALNCTGKGMVMMMLTYNRQMGINFAIPKM